MLTKGAIGNLVNRYRAVLKKCNLINTFGSLAVASMLVLGGAGVASATVTEVGGIYNHDSQSITGVSNQKAWTIAKDETVWVNDSLKSKSAGYGVWVDGFSFTGADNSTLKIEAAEGKSITYGLAHSGTVDVTNLIIKTNSSAICSYGNMDVTADDIDITSGGNGIFVATEAASGTTTIGGGDLTITAENGIRNHGNVGQDLTVTSKNVEIIASNHGIYSSNAANTSIDSDGGNVVIKGQNSGINVDRTSDVTNIGKVAVSGGNVTVESESGHAVTAVIKRINMNDETPVVSISGTQDVTITAKDSSKNAIYARLSNPNSTQPNISVNIEAGGALDINGAVKLMDVKENSVLKGKTVSIEAAAQALNVQNGWVNVVAEESIDIKSTGSYGIYSNYGTGDGISLDAEKVSVEGTEGAIRAEVSNDNGAPKVDINANQIEITGDIYAANKSSVSLGGADEYADGYKADITGDITAGAESTVNVDLGAAGSLTGSVSSADMAEGSATGVHLDLGEGSVWNATGPSTVTTLAGDDITVNMDAGAGVEAVTYSGNGGTINMVDAESSFTAKSDDASEASFKVQAIDADGNVLNADGVSSATLAAMMANVDVTDAEGNVAATSASADNGIVNNGFTITTGEDGNPVVSGGGASDVTKAVLEAASVNTVALDRILTNDVRKRLGDIRSDANKTGVWMRWDGGKLQGEGLTNNFNTIQIGGDTKVAKNCRLGVAGSFTHGDTDFARGNGELEGFSFAAYATWMGENGMFADIVARLGHFSTEVNVEGQSGDMDNRVASLSAEYGWRLPICDQFFIEPQVELAYTYVSSEDLELDTAKFSFDNVDSLTGRAGLVAGWNLPDDRGNVYARASVVQQFMGDAKVTGYSGVGATVHETDGDDTWLEYGIGANVKLTDKTYIWADVERTEGADIDEEWRGTVGIRYSF